MERALENHYMSRSARKPTLWTLRKVSTRISIITPRMLTRLDTFRLLWIFCFWNYYSTHLPPWDGMCRSGSVCADCTGWSGSTHYAEAILLDFSRDGSYVFVTMSHFFPGILYGSKLFASEPVTAHCDSFRTSATGNLWINARIVKRKMVLYNLLLVVTRSLS